MYNGISGRPLRGLTQPGASCFGSTIFEVCCKMDERKKNSETKKVRNKVARGKENEKKNIRTCKLDAIQKEVDKYSNKKETWDELENEDKDTNKCNVLGWKAWCLICKTKGGGPILSKADKLTQGAR